MRALAHGISDQAVNADSRKDQSENGKTAQDSREKHISAFLAVDYGAHAHQAIERKFDVRLRDGVSQSGRQAIRIGVRAHH